MITEKDLQEAIAECQGVRNPNANTCIKLAAYYTILEHMTEGRDPEPQPPGYSYAPPAALPEVVSYQSDSEFSDTINGMDLSAVWPVMDELMETLRVINPRLYHGVLRKLKQ